MELQELVARGRFIFAAAPARLAIFESVNGRDSAKSIAKKLKRRHSNTLRDLQALRDMELIRAKQDKNGHAVRVDGSIVYEKTPLARQIPLAYFRDSKRAAKQFKPTKVTRKGGAPPARALAVPSENEILDICNRGEDEISEFKAPGTAPRDITKEIAAFLHTRSGGIIYYGVEDDGTIAGSDLRKQDLDQRIQNSLRNTVNPAANVRLESRDVLGAAIILISVPPWNRKDVYFYEGRAYVRKGTNVFSANAEEIRRLHRGEYIA